MRIARETEQRLADALDLLRKAGINVSSLEEPKRTPEEDMEMEERRLQGLKSLVQEIREVLDLRNN